MHNNVYLIGLMGVGKTTTGRKLAELLRSPFIDTDQTLEQTTGVSIQHIFEIEGETGFRVREAKLLASICAPGDTANSSTVVSTGGGIILRASNCRMMQQSGTLIYLRAPLELLWRRLQRDRTRPLLNVPHPKRELTQLFAQRNPLYVAAADFVVDVHTETSSKLAHKIHALLNHENA